MRRMADFSCRAEWYIQRGATLKYKLYIIGVPIMAGTLGKVPLSLQPSLALLVLSLRRKVPDFF